MRSSLLALVWTLSLGCSRSDSAATDPEQPTSQPAPACLGIGPEADACQSGAVAGAGERSVLGEPLEVCSTEPMTGWTRQGMCTTGARDTGVHVVCAEMTDAFLDYTKGRGNDLSTPHPEFGFPGLSAGDRWCLCAARWAEADNAGVAPPPVLGATHEAALGIVDAKRLGL